MVVVKPLLQMLIIMEADGNCYARAARVYSINKAFYMADVVVTCFLVSPDARD